MKKSEETKESPMAMDLDDDALDGVAGGSGLVDAAIGFVVDSAKDAAPKIASAIQNALHK